MCRGYNFVVKPSTTVALVGASGSGKSTAVQLMERFYDPKQGKITLDGVPLKELSVRWLRENIGLVRQEPVLFAGTVKQNILYGAPNATSEDVQWAAAMAHAHDFIVQLPEGYDTQVRAPGQALIRQLRADGVGKGFGSRKHQMSLGGSHCGFTEARPHICSLHWLPDGQSYGHIDLYSAGSNMIS